MRDTIDWLSQLLRIITVTGELEVRCAYGVPWRVSYEQSPEREIPFHVILGGSATLDNLGERASYKVGPGDIVLLSDGSAHVLHDGSGVPPAPAHAREAANFVVSENSGSGDVSTCCADASSWKRRMTGSSFSTCRARWSCARGSMIQIAMQQLRPTN